MFVVGCIKENLPTSEATASEDLALGDLEISPDHVAGTPIEGSYIVVYKDEVMPDEMMRSLNTYEARVERADQTARQILTELKLDKAAKVTHAYGTAIKGFAVEMSAAEAQRLAADPRIAYIEQDQVATIIGGPPGGGGGGGGGGGQTTPWGITRVGGPADGTGLRAWIIDSGIDLDHPDLNVNVGLSDCFLSNCSAGPEDQHGHGTHVAGTVAAKNNSIGVVGVAAGAEVVAVRVLDRRGSGSYTGVIAGVDYVAANAAPGDAANMSLGGPISTALDAAVVALGQAGVKLAMAAGNESTNANSSSPGRANGNNLYTVSAMSEGDNWASYSNYGNPPVDYCAPGSSVYSCYKSGGYTTMSGTSMASPHVCGILLLGNVSSSGTVNGDPSAPADPIAHR
ncbi:MAG: S8 family serine peptidase [Saprospirales bacterium]|nr:S8 family serine peptidase [Saprospirales bacterium]